MFRFGMGEYIKNILYNAISVLLLAATFVACAIFTTNISEQAKMNKLFEPYIDKNSIITGNMGSEFDAEKLELIKFDKALYSREILCVTEDVSDLFECIVYDEYVMNKLTPKLKSGKIVTDGRGELLNILITDNNSGVGVGDVIEIDFFTVKGAMDGRKITVKAKVTGLIENGQKLFYGNGVRISRDMSLKDVIGTYNYEQLEESLIIIPEAEMTKIPEEISVITGRSIIKFQDNITSDERYENYRKLIEYEKQVGGISSIETYPQMNKFVDMHREETLDIIITNAPLCIAIVVLVLVCIICMISIRNARSMKYYATLYICGMPINKAVIFSGVEMTINSILAIALGTAIIDIQMNRKIFGEINCVLEFEQWLIIIGIAIFMVASVMLTTYKTLKERSPMSVLRDTAY